MFYLLSACVTVLYWGLMVGVCQAVTGYDPIDLGTRSDAGAGSMVAVGIIVAAFVLVYAFAAKRVQRWRMARMAGHG